MINNVVLMGRLVATPELRNTQTGVAVTSFTIAVERSFARAGEQRQADFIDCVAWRNSAEFISRYFQKGSMIAITGSIQTRTYDDKNGNKRKDVKNPNKSLRNVDVDKIVLIKGLKYDADDKEWGDTDIYDPTGGKIYSVDIKFKDSKTLEVYGNIWGIGKTVYWTRIEK